MISVLKKKGVGMNKLKNFLFILLGFILGIVFINFGKDSIVSHYSMTQTCERELKEFVADGREVDETFCVNLRHAIETDPIL